MEDNSGLKGIKDAKVIRIRKQEASLKVAEEEMKEIKGGVKRKFMIATLKGMEDFQVFEDFHDEKVNLAIATYNERAKSARNKVATQCPRLDLGFLDKLMGFEEGEVMVDASKDAPATIP